MKLSLGLDPEHLRVWHVALLQRLSCLPGVSVAVALASGSPGPPHVDRLLRLEAGLRGRKPDGLISFASLGDLAAFSPGNPAGSEITLDLTGNTAEGPGRHWRLIVDGSPSEAALWSAVALGRCPVVEISEGNRVIASGRVGTEAKGLLIESMEDALARTTTLILAAVAGRGPVLPAARVPALIPRGLTLADAARTAASIVIRRFARRLYRLAYRTPHWRVGWRKIDGADLFDLRRHPDRGWRDLLDDGSRFYADPFPLVRDGEVTLFVEDYPHTTGRGVISAVRFGPDGPLGRPEPVLERPYHLSYPFVFERDNEVWMIPETGEAGKIELFRATRYPGDWVKEATLIDRVMAGDATLYEVDGRWWLFATVKDGGSSSDALHLWSAPDFRGPWTPHVRNPVLVDIAGARPAGRMTMRDGILLRPVQDCREGYGAALGIARVTQLDDDGYTQQVETTLQPGALWRGRSLHTVNEAGGFEFIDGSGRARRRLRGDRVAAQRVKIGDE